MIFKHLLMKNEVDVTHQQPDVMHLRENKKSVMMTVWEVSYAVRASLHLWGPLPSSLDFGSLTYSDWIGA